MRVALLASLLIGCSGAPRPPHTPLANVSTGPTRDGDYTFRELYTGAMLGEATRRTYRLHVAGDRASLELTSESAPGAASIAAADHAVFTPTPVVRYHGSVHAEGTVTVMHLAIDHLVELPEGTPGPRDEPAFELRCDTLTTSVAAAHAVLLPPYGHHDDCGNSGVWSPAHLDDVSVMSCSHGILEDPQDNQAQRDRERWSLVHNAGLEFAFEDDGCSLTGGGLRYIP